MSQVVQRERHTQEVWHPRLQRVIRVDEPDEIIGKGLRVRGERRELTLVAARGLGAQAGAVFLDDSDEVLPVQLRVLDLNDCVYRNIEISVCMGQGASQRE